MADGASEKKFGVASHQHGGILSIFYIKIKQFVSYYVYSSRFNKTSMCIISQSQTGVELLSEYSSIDVDQILRLEPDIGEIDESEENATFVEYRIRIANSDVTSLTDVTTNVTIACRDEISRWSFYRYR